MTTRSKHRFEILEALALTHNWRVVNDATMRMLDGSNVYTLAWANRQYSNIVFGPDWEYAEVSFTYKKQGYAYAVMSITLPRKLPNVFFDSLKHEREQFKSIFDNQRRIQLEGDFDRYFTTYFVDDYTIDSLSFITPEVMLALVDANDYDIEIVHNRLLLFGKLQPNVEQQLLDMSQRIRVIKGKLLHNILTYRDERLPYKKGRSAVARAGMFLRREASYRELMNEKVGFFTKLPVLNIMYLLIIGVIIAYTIYAFIHLSAQP